MTGSFGRPRAPAHTEILAARLQSSTAFDPHQKPLFSRNGVGLDSRSAQEICREYMYFLGAGGVWVDGESGRGESLARAISLPGNRVNARRPAEISSCYMPSFNLVNDSAQPSRFSRRKVLKRTVETLTRKTKLSSLNYLVRVPITLEGGPWHDTSNIVCGSIFTMLYRTLPCPMHSGSIDIE